MEFFRSGAHGRAIVMLLAMFGPVCAGHSTAQTPPARNSDAANEPMQGGSASAQDAAAIHDAETGWYANALKTRDQRLAWWREARFGCFIHWGVYSDLGGEWQGNPNPGYAEHIMRVDKIPLATYKAEVAAKFSPDKFDANEWMRQIKAAGMQYVVLTAKHHDGFAMWPSDANPYNTRDTSHFKRDLLKEYVDAAHAQGIRVGFYYSHAFDWEDPNAPGNDWDYSNPGGDRQLYGGVNWYNEHPELLQRIDKYVEGKAIPQLKELIARYHPDILWFDTPQKLPLFEQIKIIKAVREASPTVVINGRAARGDSPSGGQVNFGDYLDTADRPAEVRPTPGDWEAIPTVNESYGWNKFDNSYKTPEFFTQLIAKSAAKGGNILLNIGPRGDGTIDPNNAAILAGIGRWMAVNGASIHGTQRTPLDRQAWGDSTVKGDLLYLHVFDWPRDGHLIVGGLKGDVETAYLLSDPQKHPLVTARINQQDLSVQIPASAPNATDTVIVLRLKQPPQGTPGRLLQADVKTNQLLAFDATAVGQKFAYGDGKTARYYVTGLEKPGSALVWSVRTDKPTTFNATVRYNTIHNQMPSAGRFVLSLGEQTFYAPIAASKDVKTIEEASFGKLTIAPSAIKELRLQLEGPAGVQTFEIDLTPAQE